MATEVISDEVLDRLERLLEEASAGCVEEIVICGRTKEQPTGRLVLTDESREVLAKFECVGGSQRQADANAFLFCAAKNEMPRLIAALRQRLVHEREMASYHRGRTHRTGGTPSQFRRTDEDVSGDK